MKIEAKLDFKSYLRLIAYLTVKRPITIIIMTFVVLFFLIGFIGQGFPFMGLGFIVFWVLFYVFSIYFGAKKNYYSNKRLDERMEYEFSDEKIIIKGETFALEMDWVKVYKVIELKSWVLIYQSAGAANIIQKESFNGYLDEFREIVKSSGVKSKLKK